MVCLNTVDTLAKHFFTALQVAAHRFMVSFGVLLYSLFHLCWSFGYVATVTSETSRYKESNNSGVVDVDCCGIFELHLFVVDYDCACGAGFVFKYFK